MSAQESHEKGAVVDSKDQKNAREPRDYEADREAREAEKTNTRVFIGSIPTHYRVSEVENLCQQYGEIEPGGINVNSDKRFAIVKFVKRSDAQYAIHHLKNKSPGGSNLIVNWAKPQDPKNAKKKPHPNAAAPSSEAAKPATETPAANAPPQEKPRFAHTQKVAQPAKPLAATPKQTQPSQPKKQAGKKTGPAAPPTRYKITIQNESNLQEVSLSISMEEWQKHILPLFGNNPVSVHNP